MNQDELKQAAAKAAISHIKDDMVVGVGSGSTVNYFIDELASIKHLIEGTVASSEETAQRLKQHGIPVYDLNSVSNIHVYVDGADEINHYMQMIKGGGGALTREKIIATVAKKMICIADESKYVSSLGKFPLPIEVIPMARSYVARQVVIHGGEPEYRQGFVTDNGNIILDVHHLKIHEPEKLESTINNITGVVCNGIFAHRTADILLLATQSGVNTIEEKA